MRSSEPAVEDGEEWDHMPSALFKPMRRSLRPSSVFRPRSACAPSTERANS